MRARTLSILAWSMAAAAGLCLYAGWHIARQRGQLQSLQQTLANLSAENRHLRQQLDDARGQLTVAADTATEKLTAAVVQDPTAADALGAWRDRTAQLKQWAGKMPAKSIPEFQFLTDDDWLAASQEQDFRTDAGVRIALNRLRTAAKEKFVPQVQTALQKYLSAHDNQLPATMTDLQPYFDPPVNDAVLQRYAVTAVGQASDAPDSRTLITERPDAKVDDIFDSQISIGLDGETTRSTMPSGVYHTNEILQAAVGAYQASHQGRMPAQVSDLQPYFTEPVDENILREIGWGWPANN